MKKLMAWSLFIILPLLFVGCGKDEPTDQEQVENKLQENDFFKNLGTTPKNRLPGVSKDTVFPHSMWRITKKDSVWWDKNVVGDEADVPVYIRWADTLVVVYDYLSPTDTVYKPAPYYHGNVRFYYKKDGNHWGFNGLTPCEIKSDSASGYVQIDSIEIKVTYPNPHTLPTIRSATQFIGVDPSYPYIFNVNDSVQVTAYRSGTVPDCQLPFSGACMLLHVPLGDHRPDKFTRIAEGVWRGTWVPKATHSARWAWVNVYDIGAILITDQMAEKSVLWGIPYKVQ